MNNLQYMYHLAVYHKDLESKVILNLLSKPAIVQLMMLFLL